MQVDYIIIGQGLCGSLLGQSLLRHGYKILVVDDNVLLSASKVAGGIINPVTGKRLVRSWMIEQLLPFALDTYNDLSLEWNVPLIHKCNILDFHITREMKEIFAKKLLSEKEYLHITNNEEEWSAYFRFNHGIGTIDPCFLLDIRVLLTKCREKLKTHDALLEEKYSRNDCVVSKDQINYKNVIAQKIVFCDGYMGADNPYFDKLPWSKDKGEALIASIPGLPRTNIFKQGINIIPWMDDLFWIGATHDWKFTDLKPTIAFRKKVEEQLDYWLKIPYKIVDHLVAQRPANMERKPFVGLHPKYDSIGILNGMGGKGCSMAPYFAHELAQHLIYKSPITANVDIKRFERILRG